MTFRKGHIVKTFPAGKVCKCNLLFFHLNKIGMAHLQDLYVFKGFISHDAKETILQIHQKRYLLATHDMPGAHSAANVVKVLFTRPVQERSVNVTFILSLLNMNGTFCKILMFLGYTAVIKTSCGPSCAFSLISWLVMVQS